MIKKLTFSLFFACAFSIMGFSQTKTDTTKAKPIQIAPKREYFKQNEKGEILEPNSKRLKTTKTKKIVLKQSTPAKKED